VDYFSICIEIDETELFLRRQVWGRKILAQGRIYARKRKKTVREWNSPRGTGKEFVNTILIVRCLFLEGKWKFLAKGLRIRDNGMDCPKTAGPPYVRTDHCRPFFPFGQVIYPTDLWKSWRPPHPRIPHGAENNERGQKNLKFCN